MRNKDKEHHQQIFNRELQMTTIVSGLNNPNLIHLNGHGNGTVTFNGNVKNNKNYLILDYHQKGNLFKYIHFSDHGFTEFHAKYIFDKILRGVQALHAAGICHRQLNLNNILLDQNFNPIIIDFAFATNNNVNALNDYVGENDYNSPQIIEQHVYNGFKNDIFSLGNILYNLITCRKGFLEASKSDNNYKLIILNKFDEFWYKKQKEIGINPSQLFKNLYSRMVAFNENDRPTIDQILQDPWFAEIRNLNNAQQNQLDNQIHNEFLQRENIANQNINQMEQIGQLVEYDLDDDK